MTRKLFREADGSCGARDAVPSATRATGTQPEWLDGARRTVLVALRTCFGVSKEDATDAVDDAARRVGELLKSGLGFPYQTSVVMHVSRLAHEWLNRDRRSRPVSPAPLA